MDTTESIGQCMSELLEDSTENMSPQVKSQWIIFTNVYDKWA